jgi:hypothetical protein
MAKINFPIIFNQLDARWKNNQHGTSNKTLGQTGCTISLLAMILVHAGYVNETPATVNKKLTDNGGYAQGNLIVWTAVPKIWPKLKWQWRYYSYDNAKAVEWIGRGMVPMIEVKATPIGGSPNGKHWVGFLGEGVSADPWGGDIEQNKIWEATGMALFEYTPITNQQIPNQEGGNMGELPSNYPDIIKKSSAYDEVVKSIFGITDRDPKNVSVDELKQKYNELKERANKPAEIKEVIKEVPVEVEKIVEKEVIKEVPTDGPREVSLYDVGVKVLESLKDVKITI